METIYVVVLFLAYAGLWAFKRRGQMKSTGVDPDVLGAATSSVQVFFAHATTVLTGAMVFLITAHGSGIQYFSLFSRFPLLDGPVYDHAGFLAGIAGLALCFIAQRQMKTSWRVGIDERTRTDLVDTGLYRFIRNPTYLGLFLVCAGTWIIWPTWTIALFGIVFYLLLEVQVRCEEDFLLRTHGDMYRAYMEETKRYIPGIY